MRDGCSEMKEEDVEESPATVNLYEVDNKEKDSQEPEDESSKKESSPQVQEDSNPEQQEDIEEGEGEGDEQSEQIPLLFVDVNLGEGTTGKTQT